MANCYVQIRCGMGPREMTVGREYDFSVGGWDTKISPNDMLEFLEKACEKAIQERFGGVYALNENFSLEENHELPNM